MAKGLYKPLNPQKYMGDPNKIRFLSSWELKLMQFCDQHPAVIQWGSEEFKVQYYNPIKKSLAMYIPDFIIKYKDAQGNLITEVVEVKPAKEATIRKKMSNYDKAMLIINTAKWQACGALCAKAGIRFRVLTEAGSIMIGADGRALQTSDQGLFRK